MPTPQDQPAFSVPDELERRSGLVLRALPILLIPVLVSFLTVLLLQLTAGLPIPPPRATRPLFNPLVPIVVLVVFCSALIILVRLGRPTVSAILLIGVWTLATTLGTVRVGVTSAIPALLIIPICTAGLLIDRVACASLAGLAIVLVCSMAWLELNGLVVPFQPSVGAPGVTFVAGFWVALFITVAALTSLLAGGLQQALRQSRAQARALRELSSQLEARVEAQTAQLLDQERQSATLAERTRLAREIHDTLAQGLTGIVVQLGAAQRAQAVDPAAAPGHIQQAQQMAREALAEARRSVWNLRAAALERGNLADALRSLASRPVAPGCTASFAQRGEARPLAPEVESALLRAAQEALANVAKHAGATQVALELAYEADAVRLRIADDGAGFDPPTLAATAAPGPAGGFGLLGMRERIAALGGTMELQNQGGAQVIVAVPWP